MAERDPLRRRGIGSETLVTSAPTAAERMLESGQFKKGPQLTPGQWSVDHKKAIKHVFTKPDGSYGVVLDDNNATEIPIDRDDGLVVLEKAPRSPELS